MSIVQKTKDLILDILFPISCLSCGCGDVWLCYSCLQRMRVFSFQVCPRCERFIIESGHLCQSCKRNSAKNKDFFLDALVVGAKYKENNLSKIIHSYKYNLVKDLRIPLGKVLTKAFLDNDLPLPDAIIPIPLHKRRLRWRGFNQSELLADYISDNLTPGMEIPVLNNILVRKKYTTPQMQVKKYSERKENIQSAFEFNEKSDAFKQLQQIKHSNRYNVLLVDDIATTGATLNECARILKENGAKKVFGLVLARQTVK